MYLAKMAQNDMSTNRSSLPLLIIVHIVLLLVVVTGEEFAGDGKEVNLPGPGGDKEIWLQLRSTGSTENVWLSSAQAVAGLVFV